MKLKLFLCLLSCASWAAAQTDTVKFDPLPKPGPTQKAKVEMSMTVGGMEAVVRGDVERQVKAGEKDATLVQIDWKTISVELAGGEGPEVELSPMIAVLGPKGEVRSVKGGIGGTDAVRMFLLTHFMPPAEGVSRGGKYKLKAEAVKDANLPERNYEGTYVGPDTVQGESAHRFDVKYSEPDKDSFAYDMAYWVNSKGELLKAEGTFRNMFIPLAGQTADGKIKVEIVK